MSIETEENNNSNSLIEVCKMPNNLDQSTHSVQNKSNAAGERSISVSKSATEAANKMNTAMKDLYINSSDSGEGTAEFNSEGTRNSNRTTSGCLSNEDVQPLTEKTTKEESIKEAEHIQEAATEVTPHGDDGVDEDVAALLLGPVAETERPPSVASDDNRSRTLSWVRSCNDDSVPFSSHLDVQAYYRVRKGDEAVDEVLRKLRSTDRYKRRANYDPDKPAAGTVYDAEYKFFLDKVCVKKLIGSLGENSEMIRAMNEVDFYISKDQSGEALQEIVTVRGSWKNVVKTVLDIRDMMHSVGKEIDVEHINTAVSPQEFVLQHHYNNFVHIRLNVAEPVLISGAMATSVILQNIQDPRYSELAKMGEEIQIVYQQLEGWKKIVSEPPERVPLPVNNHSVVIAPDTHGVYYRAIVENTSLETGEVNVWFLDYGGRETLPATSLFKLHRHFTQLPYMSLVGNLAGCKPLEGANDSFGRFLYSFVNRYNPLKATAVNMDSNGHYLILLHGAGGECINHLLIDQGLVESIPYQIFQPLDEASNYPFIYYNKKTKTREKYIVPVFPPEYQMYDPNVERQYVPQRENHFYRRNYRPNHRGGRKAWNNQSGRGRFRGSATYEARADEQGKDITGEPRLNGQEALRHDENCGASLNQVKSKGTNSQSKESAAPKPELRKEESWSSDHMKNQKVPEISEGPSDPSSKEKPSASNPTTSRKTVAAVVADNLSSASAQPTNNHCSGRLCAVKPDSNQKLKSSFNGISVRTVPNSNASDRRNLPQATSSSSRTAVPMQTVSADPDSWILVDNQKKRKNRRNKRM